MSTGPGVKFITIEEYLEMEVQSEEKHEYCAGVVTKMPGVDIDHIRIVRNAVVEIGQYLKGKSYQIFFRNLRIYIESVRFFTYPDVFIFSDVVQLWNNRSDTVTNPSIIIEVMSPETMGYDRGEKFGFYRQIPSLQEYILISSQKMMLEKFVRQPDNKWLFTEYKAAEEIITIETIGYQTALKTFYRDVTFENK